MSAQTASSKDPDVLNEAANGQNTGPGAIQVDHILEKTLSLSCYQVI